MSLQSRSIRSSTYRNRCLLRCCCCCSPADTTLALLSLHRTNVKGWPLGLPQQDHRSRGPMWRLESHCLLERTDRAQRSSRLPAQQLARLRYQRRDHSCSNITRSMLILDRMIFGLIQSGMLGHIQQSPYTSSFIEESGVEPPFIYVPFFDEYPSPAAIDQRYAQLQE